MIRFLLAFSLLFVLPSCDTLSKLPIGTNVTEAEAAEGIRPWTRA